MLKFKFNRCLFIFALVILFSFINTTINPAFSQDSLSTEPVEKATTNSGKFVNKVIAHLYDFIQNNVIKRTEDILSKDFQYVSLLSQIGNIYERLSNYEKALSIHKTILKLAKENGILAFITKANIHASY